jgi:tryptophanase
VIDLHREAGIRGVEVGSVTFARKDPKTGETTHPNLKLVRLAIPRRMYTQAHLDVVVDATAHIAERRHSLRGLRMVYAPELLRHFAACFEPV